MSSFRFTSFDGTPINAQQVGREGGVPLLLANGVGATVESYRHVIDAYGDRFRFISWDYRGLFNSGRPIGGYDGLRIEDHAQDAIALLAHLGADRFHAFGWSMGVQVLLEMARTESARLDSLVLHNGVAGKPFESLFHTPRLGTLGPALLRWLQFADAPATAIAHAAIGTPLLMTAMTTVGLVHRDLDRDLFASIIRGFKDLDLHLYFELLLRMGAHDATDVLASIHCPSLVLASGRDKMTPLHRAEEMAHALPNATLEIVPDGTHYAAVEFPALVNRILDRFWRTSSPTLFAERDTA